MTEVPRIKSAYKNKIPFYLLILYLAFEYGRVHSVLGIGVIRVQLFTSLGILIFLITEQPILRYKQTKYFLGLLGLMAIHIPFATNNYFAFLTTQIMFIYLIIHLAMIKYVVSYKAFKKMTLIWLLFGSFLCIQGIFHKGELKGTAFFGDNNDFALAMNMFLGMAYFRFLENPRKNILMLPLIGLFIVSILISFSRGGFVGLCVMLPIIWMMSRKKILGLLLGLAVVFLIFVMGSSQYWDRMRTITDTEEGTAEGRIYSWKRGWEMFLDNPLIGVGPGNYPWNVQRYEPEGGLKGKRHGGRASHSMYFTVIPELGLVGCFLFGMMLFINYKTLRGITKFGKKKRRAFLLKERGKKENGNFKAIDTDETQKAKDMMYYDALGIYAAFAGLLASGVFLSVFYYPHFWFLTSMVTVMGKLKEELEHKELAPNKEAVYVPKKRLLGWTE